MRTLSIVLILFAAVVNLAPLTGLLSTERLQALYGIPFEGSDLLILMRHRAVLFGIVGGLLVAAAFHEPLRTVGYIVGFASMLSFIAIAWLTGGYNGNLRGIILADAVAVVALLIAAVIDYTG